MERKLTFANLGSTKECKFFSTCKKSKNLNNLQFAKCQRAISEDIIWKVWGLMKPGTRVYANTRDRGKRDGRQRLLYKYGLLNLQGITLYINITIYWMA